VNEQIEIVQELRKICCEYSDILGLVILFGSYSRGEQTADSDIDLYIEPKDADMTTTQFGKQKRYKEFKYDLYDSFPNQFDLMSYGGRRDLKSIRKTPLWSQIAKDGVIVFDQRTEAV
jgi:predicted nucleotidyltransferase